MAATSRSRSARVSTYLGPVSKQLRRAVAVADRAVADAARFPNSDNPYVKFVAGLAEYRQSRPDKAVPLLRDGAEKPHDRAGPRLVLAMAQFRSGSTRDARQTLATALRTFNWKASAEETLWVSHSLRREAEAMILPDVPPFLRRGYQRRETDERIALVSICQSKGLYRAAARLFAEGFAVCAQLADDMTADCFDRAERADQPAERTETLSSECRYLAARCAAAVGCGLGNDGIELGDAERAEPAQTGTPVAACRPDVFARSPRQVVLKRPAILLIGS